MDIIINGKSTQVDGIATIGELLSSRELKASLVAVEQNGAIVPRDEFDRRAIKAGDKLEIVHFVGGGGL